MTDKPKRTGGPGRRHGTGQLHGAGHGGPAKGTAPALSAEHQPDSVRKLMGKAKMQTLREMIAPHVAAAVGVLVEIMHNPAEPAVARKGAADSMLDRMYGKAAQPIDGDGEGGPVRMVVKWEDGE